MVCQFRFARYGHIKKTRLLLAMRSQLFRSYFVANIVVVLFNVFLAVNIGFSIGQ